MRKLVRLGVLVCFAAIGLGMIRVRPCDDATEGEGKAYPFCHFGKVYGYVTWLNWIGSSVRRNFGVNLAPLDVEAYKDAVRSIYATGTSTHLSELVFSGWESQIPDFEVLAAEVNTNQNLTLLGRIVVNDMMFQAVELQRTVFNFFVKYPETSHVRIPAPIVIIGLHRTGRYAYV